MEYNGLTASIQQLHHECESCGSTSFDADDVRENKRSWIRFRKQIERIPFGCEILAMRVGANLTQKEAAELFGGGPVAFSKYEADDLVPSDAMVTLLKLAIANPSVIPLIRNVKQSHVTTRISTYDTAGVWCEGNIDEPSLSGTPAQVVAGLRLQLNAIFDPTEKIWN